MKPEKLLKFFLFGLCMIGFLAPLRNYYSHLFMAFCGFFWLITIRRDRFLHDKLTWRTFLIFISLYLIQVAGLAYTDNLAHGIFMLDTKLPLIALPIMILLSPLTTNDVRLIMRVFIAGALVACLWCQWEAIRTLVSLGQPWHYLITHFTYQNLDFTNAIPIHPAYLSFTLAISTFHVAEVELPAAKNKVLWVILIGLFTYFQLVCMSRAALVAFGAALVFYVFFKTVYRQRRFITGFVVIGLFCTAVAIFFVFTPDFRNRMVDTMINMDERLHDVDDQSSTGMHAKQWYCAWNSINGVDMIWGLGTGDEIDALTRCYQEHGFSFLATKKLDAHNEYLSSLLRHGWLGVGLLVFSFGYSVWLGYKGNNLTYITFIIMSAIQAIGASILYGQTALIIFAFCNSLFAKATLNSLRQSEKTASA